MAAATPNLMRALVIEGPRRVAVHTIATPQPQVGETLIAVEGCGLCGSNVPVWEGRPWLKYPLPPGQPGHEGWGRVVALGAGTIGVRVGDRVAFLSDRALAEFAVAPVASLCKLPSSFETLPFPGEAFGCLANIFRRAQIHRDQFVAIVGVGFLGAGLTALAKQAGAHVIAISRRHWALEMARQLGAEAVIPLSDDDAVVRRVLEKAGEGGCDVVIEAVGLQHTLALASRLVATRGRLVIAGFHQDGKREVDMFTWNWRGIDVINAHERQPAIYVDGMRVAIDAVTSGALDVRKLVTHRFDFAHAGDALDAVVRRPDGFLKAVVAP